VSACPVCDSHERAREHEDAELSTWRCRACGHRTAEHAAAEARSDYYEHTPQDPRFVASLGATRRRQAGDILARVAALDEAPWSWLDLGCGRGWFLREARARGVARAWGFDTSRLATDALRGDGFPMAGAAGAALWPDWSTLPGPPDYVSLLDVLEHFEGGEARAALVRLRAELPALRAVVVKVPTSEGVFFRAARALAAAAPGAYRQLFQVGTFPPHWHYFCRGSLERLLADAGFETIASWTDRDVDNLFHRIPAIASWPGGALAAGAVRLLPADALIVVARPRR
jgi:hypothetical protein